MKIESDACFVLINKLFLEFNVKLLHISNISEADHNMKQPLEDVHR